MGFDKTRAVIYDLDGTIVDTEEFHKVSWEYAARQLEVLLTRQMLIDQKGIPGKDAVKMMLGERYERDGKEFLRVRSQWELDNLKDVKIFDGFMETVDELSRRDVPIGICTSANQEFWRNLLTMAPELARFSNCVVKKGDYRRGKPHAEPLLQMGRRLGVSTLDIVYVGDAHSDWQCADNAAARFVYFCRGERDNRIPEETILIGNHKRLLNYIEFT